MSSHFEHVDQHVGARLKARRIALKMSQEQVAEQVGVTFQQIQKYEKGSNRIGASRLFAIGQVLRVSVDYFFAGLEGCEGGATSPEDPNHLTARADTATQANFGDAARSTKSATGGVGLSEHSLAYQSGPSDGSGAGAAVGGQFNRGPLADALDDDVDDVRNCFAKISDPRLRRSIIAMVRAAAEDPSRR